MPTAAYYTLGCKVNQYETEKIRQEMQSHGISTVSFSSSADVYIINSCTVTGVADSKSRHAVRQAVRRNPDAYVVATGCYAQLEPNELACIEGVDLVVPNDEKDDIVPRVMARFPDLRDSAAFPSRPRLRTRAILKVQDGCDQFCAYCAVPFARTGKRNRSFDEVLAEARALADYGHKEIVLTGIRLGSYGDDGRDIADLAQAIAGVDGIARVRLSSIEVWEISERLLDVMANDERVCRHLHVPLQSGDDDILGAMNRPYDTRRFRDVVGSARSRMPELAITTDVLVGFPGETDEQLEHTRSFVESIGFARLHVFKFSPRPRTKAASLGDQVPAPVKDQRSHALRDVGNALAQRFAEKYVGRTVSVLAEGRVSASGQLKGFTGNYIEAQFIAPASAAGSIVRLGVSSAQEGRLHGKVL